jgi:sugar lactone lactonase YvrE
MWPLILLMALLFPLALPGNAATSGVAEVLLSGLSDARSVRTSTLGNIFVVETGRHRILKLDREGIRVDSVGRLGNGDYQFDVPVAMDPTNELKIYVADRNNRRIQVFDRRLQYLSTLHMPQRAGLPSRYLPAKLTVDPSGNIYFFDEDRHVMYRFDSHGQYELDFELFGEDGRIVPVAMAMHDDELWVAGQRGELIHRFTSRGSYLGFVYAPEPVRSLRSAAGSVWMIGPGNIIRFGTGDEAIRTWPLPELPGTMRAREHTGSRSRAEWHSFDIRDNVIYLLSSGSLVRVELSE